MSQSDIAVKNQIQDLGSLDLDWGHHDIHQVVHFKLINIYIKQSSRGVINYFHKLSFAMKTRCDFSCLCIFLLQIMILSFKIWIVLTEPSTSSEEAHPETGNGWYQHPLPVVIFNIFILLLVLGCN